MTIRLFLLLLLLAACPMWDAPRKIPVAYSTPESTITAYWHRMIERRYPQALDCFLYVSAQDHNNLLALPDVVELRCIGFEVMKQGRGVADIRYTVEFRVTMADSLQQFVTGDRLYWTHRGWKIAQPLLNAGETL